MRISDWSSDVCSSDLRKRITAETCIHFLRFDRGDYERLGHLIKCNPAIKDASDREALIQALASDVIDVLATDHAPHTWEEKHNPYVRARSEEHTSELQSLMSISYALFCLKKKKQHNTPRKE